MPFVVWEAFGVVLWSKYEKQIRLLKKDVGIKISPCLRTLSHPPGESRGFNPGPSKSLITGGNEFAITHLKETGPRVFDSFGRHWRHTSVAVVSVFSFRCM